MTTSNSLFPPRWRSLPRAQKTFRDANLVVIATEGEKSEPQYFGAFGDHRIRVHTLPSVDGRSSPQHVLDRMIAFKKTLEKKLDIKTEDEFWLVLDTDRWKGLDQIVAQARQHAIKLAISNPCFEVWLLCHLENPKGNNNLDRCDNVKYHLRQIMDEGYDHANLQTQRFLPFLKEAFINAKKLDPNPDNPWPYQFPATHVYRMFQEGSLLARFLQEKISSGTPQSLSRSRNRRSTF